MGLATPDYAQGVTFTTLSDFINQASNKIYRRISSNYRKDIAIDNLY